jgi:Flp pilus assembly protein TadB
MIIGLFFFIRAATKERTEEVTLVAKTSEDAILEQLKTYFQQRAYRVESIDQSRNQVIFSGILRPSWFLTIFLSFLAGAGLLCLGLILSYLWSEISPFIPYFALFAPTAGWFYWQRARRLETVALQVNATEQETFLTLTGHRDELKTLQKTLALIKA